MKLYAIRRFGSVKVKPTTRTEDRAGNWVTSPGIMLKFNRAWMDRDQVTNILRPGPEVIDTEKPGPHNLLLLQRGWGDEWKKKYDAWWKGMLDEGLLTKDRPEREVTLKLSEAEMARILADRKKAASEGIADNEDEEVVMPRGVRTSQGPRQVGKI